MEQEIIQLKSQIDQLKQVIDFFVYPDRYNFERSIQHKGSKLGFYKVEPIIQPSSTGTTSSMTTVGGTTVTESNGFNGTIGTTYYTIGDIVKHLKNLGLLKK